MTEQWSLPAYAVLVGIVGLAVLVLTVLMTVVLAVRAGSRARRADQRLAVAESEAAALRESVTAIERRLTSHAPPEERSDYVITRVGDRTPAAEERAPAAVSGPPTQSVVAPPLFADLVLRESVVQAASLAAGLRRALAPETRHRIRFEMRREVKRARKQRRSDLRAARRAWEAREREAMAPRAGEGSAA